jgi:hypothetical protein
MNKWIATAALTVASLISTEGTARADRAFPHPDRIRYDGQCFTIEGKDTFIFSGAFHYFRCPKELWNDRFDKIKAAGFNCVETYVAWNKEEPTAPASLDDYSKVDLKDLEDWLTMAEAHGLYVILRPGPYICAEWDCGGFPQWLIAKKPADYHTGHMWLRSDEPSFVGWSNHWFHAVDQIAVKHQITHRKPGTGGIIIYQLENEYGGVQPDDVEVRYVHALGQQALNDGIDVPFMTCWTGVVRGSSDPILKQVYDSCNFYPRWNVTSVSGEIAKLEKEQTDAPPETTELQGGWFSNPGSANSLAKDWSSYIDGCGPTQIQNLTLYAIEKGDRVTNYYMLFGGTNFGDWAPENITTSYDYSAPIRELGGVGEKYQRVAAIGKMLAEHGGRFARALPMQCEAKTDQKDVTVAARRAADGGIYFFVRTNQHNEPRKGRAVVAYGAGLGTITLNYDLEPFGAKVFWHGASLNDVNGGEWLPKPAAEIARPAAADLPAAIPLSNFVSRADAGAVAWQPFAEGTGLEKLGIYGRRFIFYRTHATIAQDQLKSGPLSLAIAGPQRDHVGVTVNGQFDPTIRSTGSHVARGLHAGDNTIEITYENVGQPNGGNGMEEMSGIRKITLQNPTEAAANSVGHWRMLKVDSATKPWQHAAAMPELAPDFDASTWRALANKLDGHQLAPNESAIFRSSIDVTADQLKLPAQITVDQMDDHGWVFINGKKVGEGHSWSETFSFPVQLHEGKNNIAILIRNEDGAGGLGPVHFEFGAARSGLPIEIGTESQGYAGKWWDSTDATGWGTAAADTIAPLTWLKTTFELPAAKPHVWVPWVARLDMTGNSFLYLNGHALGRYWQVGPQHDFFLPECWLNFGPGKTNTLTICRRNVDGGEPIKSAQVVPVNELAETR